jgi:hypothetical protein
MHQTSVEPLLQKMGVAYNPADKYKGYSGKQLGKPKIPELLKVY